MTTVSEDFPKKILAKLVPRLGEAGKREPEPEEDNKAPRPEERLNIAILRAAILWKVMNGFGTLAFVWATVVLLGGFATLITQRDFWFVTTISFIQAVGIFGANEDPTNQFALRVSEGLTVNERLLGCLEQDIWQRHREPMHLTVTQQELMKSLHCCRTCLGGLLLTAFSLAKLAAVTVLFILSSMRLSKQDYVDPMFRGDLEHKNIRRSLNMFYGLVLAQGICYLCSILNPLIPEVLKVSSRYKLGISGRNALVNRYLNDNYESCIRGNVRAALNMDLVSYAMELVTSNSATDQLLGVRTIDDVLSVGLYRKLALASIRASPETLEKLFKMLALNEETRGPAASIVLDLAPCIMVESVPGMIELTSVLLDERSSGNNELAWFGLSILEELMVNNPSNCLHATEVGNLLSKVIGLTNWYSHGHGRTAEDLMLEMPHNLVEKEILKKSLRVIHKLVATDIEAAKVLKRDTAENIQFLSNDRMITEHVEAIRIVACCTLDEEAREQIGNYPEIIKALKTCLFSDQVKHSAAAAEALVLLTMDNKRNVVAILEEIDSKETMQQVVNMLFVADGGHRTSMAAKLLHNFRACSGTDYLDQNNMMDIIDKAMPEVLKAIKMRVNRLEKSANTSQNSSNGNFAKLNIEEEGKVLESFIGLSVQICDSLNSCDFAKKHENGSHPTIDMLVQKLKQILEMYCSPTTETPGIRRVTIELMIWIMQSNKRNIESFRRFNVATKLEEVARAARKLESFRLFYSGLGVARYSKPISHVARAALALIAIDPAS
ncbi:unnamed protein product [Urochloa decumbens]|uniref:Uncharacterized protein n=1 Tax=Urochloa decumbens TaxID=240449 RepID=A0ABC9DAM0_9POAL